MFSFKWQIFIIILLLKLKNYDFTQFILLYEQIIYFNRLMEFLFKKIFDKVDILICSYFIVCYNTI
jgi:hypothetical protein